MDQREGGMAKIFDSVHSTGEELENEEEEPLSIDELNNWLVHAIPIDTYNTLVACEEDPNDNEALAACAYFKVSYTLLNVRIEVGLYGVANLTMIALSSSEPLVRDLLGM